MSGRTSYAAKSETITSRENRWLKRFRAALHGSDTDLIVIGIEGARMVAEAGASGLGFEAVLVSEHGERHLTAVRNVLNFGARLLRTSDRLFAWASGTESPQGIAALVRPRQYAFEDLLRGGEPLIAVLVGVQDPGNVGTIVRSAEAFGATGVIATRGTAHPLAPKALRASAASALRLPLLAGLAPPVTLAQLRVAGVRTFAASLSDGATPAEEDFTGPCAFLIGNEGAGLAPELERSADARVRIPLAAGVDSLNAAMAATVLLYEAARQRRAQARRAQSGAASR